MDNDSQIPIIQNVVHKKSVSMMMCNYKVIVKIQKSDSMRTTNTMMIWIDWKKKIQNLLLNLPMGSYINHVDSWGGGRLAKLPFYYISLILKVWPRGVKNAQKFDHVVYGWPQWRQTGMAGCYLTMPMEGEYFHKVSK